MEKQKKLKFNLVDVIFILVLLAGAAFLALRLTGGLPGINSSNNGGEEYIVTFYVSDSADYIIDHLQIGSPVTDDSITLNFGILVDFETGPAQITSTSADGRLIVSDREGYSSVYLMCRVRGADNGFGITVGSQKLGVGHTTVVRAREAKFWVTVYDIQQLSDTPYAGQ